MHDFRRLRVWQDSMDLAEAVYRLSAHWPARERYGLVAQIRSSAVSVSSNIAEGAGRGGEKEMARFLRVALGSLAELESQIELAQRLGLVHAKAVLAADIKVLARRVLRLHDRITGSRP